MMVRVSTGALAGNTYEYVGPATDDSNSITEGKQPFDLNAQTYGDPTLCSKSSTRPTRSEP